MPKPTHTYFCIGAKRTKLRFETQKKADNFIKFNGQTIKDENGKAPIRSYYCEFCCAWHVTSNPHRIYCEKSAENRAKKMERAIIKIEADNFKPQKISNVEDTCTLPESKVLEIANKIWPMIREVHEELKSNFSPNIKIKLVEIRREAEKLKGCTNRFALKVKASMQTEELRYQELETFNNALPIIEQDPEQITKYSKNIVAMVLSKISNKILGEIKQGNVKVSTKIRNFSKMVNYLKDPAFDTMKKDFKLKMKTIKEKLEKKKEQLKNEGNK